MSGRWRNTSPHELVDWLAGVDMPWGIAGGWALDLWQGTVTREHSDIEIACFRSDLPQLLPTMQAFEIVVAQNKVLTPWRANDPLPDGPFSLWLRRHGEPLWDFEIVAESRRDNLWVYQREVSVTLPPDEVFLQLGLFPIVRPEIQLLYKCKEPRPKDVDDLACCVPMLDAQGYRWLRDAVTVAHPEFLATLAGFRGT